MTNRPAVKRRSIAGPQLVLSYNKEIPTNMSFRGLEKRFQSIIDLFSGTNNDHELLSEFRDCAEVAGSVLLQQIKFNSIIPPNRLPPWLSSAIAPSTTAKKLDLEIPFENEHAPYPILFELHKVYLINISKTESPEFGRGGGTRLI